MQISYCKILFAWISSSILCRKVSDITDILPDVCSLWTSILPSEKAQHYFIIFLSIHNIPIHRNNLVGNICWMLLIYMKETYYGAYFTFGRILNLCYFSQTQHRNNEKLWWKIGSSRLQSMLPIHLQKLLFPLLCVVALVFEHASYNNNIYSYIGLNLEFNKIFSIFRGKRNFKTGYQASFSIVL